MFRGAAKVGWDSLPSDEGKSGVSGGVRSLMTQKGDKNQTEVISRNLTNLISWSNNVTIQTNNNPKDELFNLTIQAWTIYARPCWLWV